MNIPNLLKVTVAVALCFCGAAFADEGKDESGKGKRDHREHRERGVCFDRHSDNRLNIPYGHYPSRGEFRIWYPDRPAGHQPPPRQRRER